MAGQLAMALLQQLPCGSHHPPGADFEQSIIRRERVAVAGVAHRTAEHDAAGLEGAVARRIGRSEDPDDGNSEGRRQMHGAGIAADEQTSATSERDELCDRSCKCFSRTTTGDL